uniref:BUB1 N-terminal domain-containing protein n=1 Tax=Heterorhabditis bacteriophora TaxID=37862 RepID=A0A1I7X7M9_HETBA
MINDPHSLRFLSTRIIGLQLFKIKWYLFSYDKHLEMFINSEKTKERVINRSEHLRTFYNQLIWKNTSLEIDDRESALHLMQKECADWPQMQFQFACMYAVIDWIEDQFRFDKYRRITFKKQLSDHPVYDFWLTLLESNWEIFFDTERRIANQRLILCLQFAIRHGYCQLVQYIWNRIGDTTKEYIGGLLQWRAMCFRARDRDTMRFLCDRLCVMNPSGVARISWTAFFDTFYNSVNRTAEDNIRGIQVAINIQEDEDLEEIRKRKRHRMRRNSSEFPSMMTAPKHVHGGDWKDMLHLTDFHQKKKGNSWIEHKLKKRECNQFVPTQRYSSRCGCGMPELQHSSDALRTLCSHKFLTLPGADDEATSDADNHKITNSSHRTHGPRWTIGKNTITSSTDAYGTIVFEGGPLLYGY